MGYAYFRIFTHPCLTTHTFFATKIRYFGQKEVLIILNTLKAPFFNFPKNFGLLRGPIILECPKYSSKAYCLDGISLQKLYNMRKVFLT